MMWGETSFLTIKKFGIPVLGELLAVNILSQSIISVKHICVAIVVRQRKKYVSGIVEENCKRFCTLRSRLLPGTQIVVNYRLFVLYSWQLSTKSTGWLRLRRDLDITMRLVKIPIENRRFLTNFNMENISHHSLDENTLVWLPDATAGVSTYLWICPIEVSPVGIL